MAVVPADESRAAEDVAQILARDVQRPVVGRAGGENHGIVERLQFFHGHVLADGDIAHETDVVRQGCLLVPLRDALDRLVIWGDPGANQPVGDGQPVEDVDPDSVLPMLMCSFGGIVSCWA